MFRTTLVGGLAIALTLATPAAWAQSVISARAGLVHYTEGTVSVDGELLLMEFGRFPLLKSGSVISTENGYVEVLLAPGAFLRLAPDSAVKMVNDSIHDTKLEVQYGAAMVEVGEITKGAFIGITLCGEETIIGKRGLYEFNADVSRVRVYDGKLQTEIGGESEELKKGRMVAFDEDPEVEKFKTKDRSQLYYWSQSRSQQLAMANVGAATAAPKGFITTNSWVWNSYLSMFTFVPYGGTYRSPFGYRWYSPQTVWIVTSPPPRSTMDMSGPSNASWGGIQSSRAASSSSSADSGAVRSAAPAAAAPAAVSTSGRSR